MKCQGHLLKNIMRFIFMLTVSLVPRKYQLWASHANFALNIYFSNTTTEIAVEKKISISLKCCETNNQIERSL